MLQKTLPGERFTPLGLARKLKARVLLESASFVKGRERYSLLLLQEAFQIRETRDGVFMMREGKRLRVRTKGRDILDVLRYFADQHADVAVRFPFPAGGIGFVGYEYATRFDTINLTEKPDPQDLPDAVFLFGHVFLVFDHYLDALTLVAINYREHEIDLAAALHQVEQRINDLDFNFMSAPVEAAGAVVDGEQQEQAYLAGVAKVRDEIIRGNLLQGVLSRRLYVRTKLTALDAYRGLRSVNPSPYMFYLDFGDFQLFGASPEVHVRVKGRRVVLRPLAGTRPRGATEEEDLRLEADLLSDEKELAEHLMLVDLGRNDLARVCLPGSVTVTERNVVERYSHVMHIVSQVEGDLRDGYDGTDALRATFPAGTVSGAPKIRAIEVIDALEPQRRTFYAGVVGYLEPGGTLDSCITIRSALKKGDLLVLQAGAGIVYDSVPERELQETANKLGALSHAVGIKDPGVVKGV